MVKLLLQEWALEEKEPASSRAKASSREKELAFDNPSMG
jgi:hypothetical protein